MQPSNVIAIAVSDIHLSLKAPVARKDDIDWQSIQSRHLKELRAVSDKYQVPVLCAGDLFHHWNSPAELINFAIENLPDGMVCIPGQHDLPYHSHESINKSAYSTLIKCGKIHHLGTDTMRISNGRATVTGMPWGVPIGKPRKDVSKDSAVSIALIHQFVWKKGHTYPGALPTGNVRAIHRKLQKYGYSVAVCGDNHKGFLDKSGGTTIYNNGGFIRRNIDEVDRVPTLGLIYSDGTVKLRPINAAEKDLFCDRQDLRESTANVSESSKAFLKSLGRVGQTNIDFKEAVRMYINTHDDIPSGVSDILMELIDNEH